MAKPGARARRGAGLLAALIASVVVGLMAPGTAAAQPCDDLQLPGCTTDPTEPPPTEPSTTIEATTTTAAAPTTTEPAVERTTTTRRTATTTATTTGVVVATTTSSTISVSTSVNLLVPGDGTEGAESTTTSAAPKLAAKDSGPSDQQLLGIVIGGLVLMALAVAVLTWRYWKATRPPAREAPAAGPTGSGADRSRNGSP